MERKGQAVHTIRKHFSYVGGVIVETTDYIQKVGKCSIEAFEEVDSKQETREKEVGEAGLFEDTGPDTKHHLVPPTNDYCLSNTIRQCSIFKSHKRTSPARGRRPSGDLLFQVGFIRYCRKTFANSLHQSAQKQLWRLVMKKER